MPNRDGIEPGQLVDFSTLMRIERMRRRRVQPPAREGDNVTAEQSAKAVNAVLTAKHRGRGRYDVLDEEGNVVAASLKRGEAQAYVDR